MREAFLAWWRTHYDHHLNNQNDMRDAFEAGAKYEREECAKIAIQHGMEMGYEWREAGNEIAKQIRARGG